MADHLTLDVIDRPRAGVLRTMRAIRSLGHSRPPGLRALLQLGTARFVPRPVRAPTLRRVAALAVWEDEDAVERSWESSIGALGEGAREHWHIHGELARASFSCLWQTWDPDVADARRLTDDEPALIVISGNLRPRYVPMFFRDAAKAVAQAFEQPGYLGGLAIASSPLNTTSCSAWRSYRDAKEYAFKPGMHSEAMKRDRANGHHSTEWFVRIRPLAERGTLGGSAPFAGALAPAQTAS